MTALRSRLDIQYRSLLALATTVLLLTGCAGLERRGQRHALWEITDHNNTVYLMGSIHVLPKEVYPLSQTMEAAFQKSTQVVFEVDPNRYSDAEIEKEVTKTGLYRGKDRLEKHIGPRTKEILVELLASVGLSLKDVEQMKPWFLAEVITSGYLEASGYQAQFGLDEVIYQKARSSRKKVAGLERVRDQTSIFSEMSDGEAEAYLLDSLSSLLALKPWMARTVSAWQRGAVEELDQLLNTSALENPKMHRRLFVERNGRWLPQIEKMIEDNTNYLVVVGAGHLVGNDGLVLALRRKGYRVEQL